MAGVLLVYSRQLTKARGWWGDSEGHREAAKKGWQKRIRPPTLDLGSAEEYRDWFLQNLAGRHVVNESTGLPIVFDSAAVWHAISEPCSEGGRRFSWVRARRLSWVPVVARFGEVRMPPPARPPRPWVVAIFQVPRAGAHAIVIELDKERETAWFVTHFPLRPQAARRIRLEWSAYHPKKKPSAARRNPGAGPRDRSEPTPPG